MLFTLNGQKYDLQLTKEEVERAMGGIPPSRGKYYFVVVNGEKYPPSQVLYLALRERQPGLSQSDFSSYDAKNFLSEIGFDVVRPDGSKF